MIRSSVLYFFLFLLLIFYGCSKLPPQHEIITAESSELRIPLGKVNDGKAHFFTYKKSGKRINFFVRTDHTGRLSAYFDTCFTCYKNKKGYRDEGASIVCNECNMRFSLADEKFDNSQGCSPIALSSRIDEKNIIIKTGSVEKGGKLF